MALEAKILDCLKHHQKNPSQVGLTAKNIAYQLQKFYMFKITKKNVNPILYTLEKNGYVGRLVDKDGPAPRWKIVQKKESKTFITQSMPPTNFGITKEKQSNLIDNKNLDEFTKSFASSCSTTIKFPMPHQTKTPVQRVPVPHIQKPLSIIPTTEEKGKTFSSTSTNYYLLVDLGNISYFSDIAECDDIFEEVVFFQDYAPELPGGFTKFYKTKKEKHWKIIQSESPSNNGADDELRWYISKIFFRFEHEKLTSSTNLHFVIASKDLGYRGYSKIGEREGFNVTFLCKSIELRSFRDKIMQEIQIF
jgi:hypothetical protein